MYTRMCARVSLTRYESSVIHGCDASSFLSRFVFLLYCARRGSEMAAEVAIREADNKS